MFLLTIVKKGAYSFKSLTEKDSKYFDESELLKESIFTFYVFLATDNIFSTKLQLGRRNTLLLKSMLSLSFIKSAKNVETYEIKKTVKKNSVRFFSCNW